MHITLEFHNDQFNVNLSSKEGAEAFLSIKGCRVVQGNDGEFLSYPATKNQKTGKYWKHVYGSDKFNAAVLEKYHASRPQQRRQSRDDDDSAPF